MTKGSHNNARNDGGARSEGGVAVALYFEFTLRRMWLHNKYLTREKNMAYRQNFWPDKSRISRAATERPTNDTNMSYFALNTHAVEDALRPGARNRLNPTADVRQGEGSFFATRRYAPKALPTKTRRTLPKRRQPTLSWASGTRFARRRRVGPKATTRGNGCVGCDSTG